jgi:hypothetical protein
MASLTANPKVCTAQSCHRPPPPPPSLTEAVLLFLESSGFNHGIHTNGSSCR